MSNKEIREAIAKKRLRHYEVANALGMSPYTFAKKIRLELPEDEKKRILDIIDKMQI
ncbi:MAG: hypothetical protein IJ141_03595 [Lachnospiraceae bacterium]|nr:hypothetical protein [Lachnospiraceae bacterium]MBR1460237.1 hypothetical protein [bacterium]